MPGIDALKDEAHILNRNGAWCWYQDERALIDPATQTLVVGSVAAPEGEDGESRAGNIEVTVLNLATGESQIVVLHENLEVDDHDVPALWHRRDGRWLAVYTTHGRDSLSRWRISEPNDPTTWGPEQTFDWSQTAGAHRVTYSNLHELDGRLYCFARSANDDNGALVSDDEGDTWTFAGKLFDRPKIGYVNGYCRYASTPDRIDVITTDHHPRDFNNSIFHGYLSGGALRASDGTVVDPEPLSGQAPNQSDLTTILAADSVWDGEEISHCWTTDIRRGTDGSLAVSLTARANFDPENPSFDDHRFFYGRLDTSGNWQMHQVAKAGAALLPHEQDYTGLIAIDPHDLDHIYISTPIDPRTGEQGEHYEIYSGQTSDAGATWEWTAVTENSEVDNLRPIVAPGDPGTHAVLWFRGWMTHSQHYNCEIVAKISAN